jgi:hypothetical protein
MARNRGPWGRLMESTEGPTVTLNLPREWAEELLNSLMSSLELADGADEMDMGDPQDDMDADAGMDMTDGDADMDDPMADLDFDLDGGADQPAGDLDDDSDDEPPAKRGPGRPPGKSKKKDDAPKKKEPPKKDDSGDDDDDEDEKDEDLDFSRGPADGFAPGIALGESAFARAARAISARRHPRAPRR